MKQWRHQVDRDWLNARKDVITATEIRDLVSEHKRFKGKSGQVRPGLLALWAKKNSEQEIDVNSYGAAARGHVMEPFAIEEWNSQTNGCKFHHWDDIIIEHDGVGFSPDALDCEPDPAWCPKIDAGKVMDATEILEVKCYAADHHIKAAIENKMSLPERFQIAVGMFVMPTIEKGTLLLYNPSMLRMTMAYHEYTRDDLEDEIKIVGEIVEQWKETWKHMQKSLPAPKDEKMSAQYTEDYIYKEMLVELGERVMM